MTQLRRSWRALALAVPILFAGVSSPAAAQVRALQLTSDNDAYDFWIPLDARPDYEYSNGLRLAVEVEGARGWKGLARAVAPCVSGRAAADAEAGCASTAIEVGQRLYAPRWDTWDPVPGQRPYAGWLYAAATGRVVDGATRHTFALEAGVTGEPSQGRRVMEEVHRIGGFWQPMGWRHQLGFEPAVALRYAVERRLAEARVGGVRAGDLIAEAGASAGNLRTAVHAEARARAGTRLPHAWAAAPRAASVYAVAGVRGEAVAHDLFLDGGDARVTRTPWVAQTTWGVGVSTRAAAVEFRAQRRSAEYREAPGGHPYSTIEITWRP